MEEIIKQGAEEKDRKIFSYEREMIPFEKVMPLQFKLIEMMLPEGLLREAVKQGLEKIERNEEVGELCDYIYLQYTEKYMQLFDDYCREYPSITKKVIEDSFTTQDCQHIIRFFYKRAEVFFTPEEIKDLSDKYLH